MYNFDLTCFRDETNFLSTSSLAKPDRYIADRQTSITDLSKEILMRAQVGQTIKLPSAAYQESLYAAADLQPGKRLLQFDPHKHESPRKKIRHVAVPICAEPKVLEASTLLHQPFNQPIALSSQSSLASIHTLSDSDSVYILTPEKGVHSLPDVENLAAPLCVSFAAESEDIVTGGPDQQVRIWDHEKLKKTRTIATQAIPSMIATSQNLILSGSLTGKLALVDPRSKNPTFFKTAQSLTAIALSSTYFATAGNSSDSQMSTIKFRDLRMPSGSVFVSHKQESLVCPIHSLQFNPRNGAQIATSGSFNQTELRIYDLNRSSLIAEVDTGLSIVNGFWSGDGHELITLHSTSEKTGTYKTWRFDAHPKPSLQAGQSVVFPNNYCAPWHAAINPSQGSIAVDAKNSDTGDAIILLWDLFQPTSSKTKQPDAFAAFGHQIR